MINKCNLCLKKLQSHSKKISCHICKTNCHIKCISLNPEETISISSSEDWICVTCSSNIFPFNHFFEDSDFYEAIYTKDHFDIDWDKLANLVFNPMSSDDVKISSPLDDIDPDDNFFNELAYHATTLCKYYNEDKFHTEVSNPTSLHKNKFSLLHANLRSMPRNFSAFSDYIDTLKHKWTCIGITETWLTENNHDLYNLNGYRFINRHRTNKSGGGVGLFIPENIDFSIRTDLSVYTDVIESLFLEICVDSKKTIVGVVYRPPGGDLKVFNNTLSDILDKLRSEKNLCYLLGDWNINILSYEAHPQTTAFIDMMYQYGFLPLINRPTRVSSTSATIIDNIFSNNNDVITNSCQGIMVTDISDHFPIFHISNFFDDTAKDIYITKRSFTEENKRKFLEEIGSFDWDSIYKVKHAQHAFSLFHTQLCTAFNKHFPKKRIKVSGIKYKPWLTEELKQMIKHKNKLYHISQSFKTSYNEMMYKTHRNRTDKLRLKAERDYYSNLLEASKSNMKKTWGILKTVINKKKDSRIQSVFKVNDETISDKKVIAEKFNDFFVNVGPNLASKIPQQNASPINYLGDSVTNSIFLNQLTEKEFDEIFDSLKKCAPGYDEIGKDILQISLPFTKNPLIYLLNLSLSQGIFPQELKTANVIPLFKSDDPMRFNNYRPVSLLSIFSKIYEKVMYNRIISFLTDQKILYERQFGFRKHHSTYMPLMLLIDKLAKAMEEKEYVIGVFLDFSKAFDTVDHNILLDKLYHYGIRGIAHDWLKSYLNNRQQFVTYNETTSSTSTIRCGVPQGSILGPILFLIYINDLVNVCNNSHPYLFADDTNLFTKGKNLQEIACLINKELKEISIWLKVNKLSLNIKKTHYMIFTSSKKVDKVNIEIDGHPIGQVDDTKFLGVFIDKKLTWKKHINYIKGKVARGIGILTKARSLLNTKALKTLYHSFIYPYFSYCNHVWGCVKNKVLEKLIRLQKRAVKIITFSKYRDSPDPLFEKNGILKLTDINIYSYGKFMYNWYHKKLPTSFNNSFKYVREVHNIGTKQSTKGNLFPPKAKNDLVKSCFSYKGVIIWNAILKNKINPEVSPAVFSKTLKQCIKVGLLN